MAHLLAAWHPHIVRGCTVGLGAVLIGSEAIQGGEDCAIFPVSANNLSGQLPNMVIVGCSFRLP